jgi:hypothetical protein
VIFALSGVFIIMQASMPIVFDKSARMFYRGRKQPKIPDATDSKHTVSFNDIHAIQLLTRLESSSNADNSNNQFRRTRYYRVYEMNLVKHDGKRKYVNTFGKDDIARHDANIIADFIGVPVWDGIDG